MKRSLLFTFMLLVAITTARAQVPDFGSKFFDDLRNLFGRLQQSELDRAFQRAQSIHCSDLVSGRGEWKQVAFLNDDRTLGDWHYERLGEVKEDLTSIVFSGSCRGDQGPVSVVTSHPVKASMEEFKAGKITFSQIEIKRNPPVSVIFDSSTNAYSFQVPYLYIASKSGIDVIYTDSPPLSNSKPEPEVAEDFRCKAVSDAELTYRFLLCRNRVVSREPRATKQTAKPGNAAYYILSDGKEAASTVKLSFESAVEPAPPEPERQQPVKPEALKQGEREWRIPAPQITLAEIANAEFTLGFNSQMWRGRITAPQLLSDGRFAAAATTPPADHDHCVWRPVVAGQVEPLAEQTPRQTAVYSLVFAKEMQTTISATFEIENISGVRIATLQCYFPQSQTPADVSVSRWTRVVGTNLQLSIRGQ